MNKNYPELQQFLAGYFNQDWVDDHENADEVIANFITESSETTIVKVKQELTKLISVVKSEKELYDILIAELGCCYYYPSEWKDGLSWLTHVYSSLSRPYASNQS